MITVPSLNDTSDILNTDMVMVTHSDGSTEKISGADLNKRNQVIFSANKTLTGTPLKAGNVVRVCFTQDITGLDTSSVLQLEYNEVDKNVKVNKDGTLIDFVATEISSGVYKYVQAYTVLELLYDGTQFIIIGNPVVISDDGFKYYANGDHSADVVAVDNMHSVTSNAVAARFSKSNYSSSEIDTGYKWIDGSTIYKRTFSYLSKELQYGTSVELTNNCPIIPEKIRSVECFFKEAYISHTSAEIWFTKISGQDKCSININQTIRSATYDVYITVYYVH